jgi:hypothetical protein
MVRFNIAPEVSNFLCNNPFFSLDDDSDESDCQTARRRNRKRGIFQYSGFCLARSGGVPVNNKDSKRESSTDGMVN